MNIFIKKNRIKNIIYIIAIIVILLWLLNLYFKFTKPLYLSVGVPIIVLFITNNLYTKDIMYQLFELGRLGEFYEFSKKRYGYKNVKYKKLIFIMACLMGEEEVLQSYDRIDIDTDLAYLEYILVRKRFDEAKKLLNQIKSQNEIKDNNNFLWTEEIADALISNDYMTIINKEVGKSDSIIQRCRLNYWKGYALYMMDRKNEAYSLFKQVIDYGTNTIYEQDAKKYIVYKGENKDITHRRFIEYLSLKNKLLISLSCILCLGIVINIIIPMKDEDVIKIYSKYFYCDSASIEIVKEEGIDDYKQLIVLNYRTDEIDYCLFRKKENKYIFKKVKRMPFFGKDNSDVVFSDIILLTPYYDEVGFKAMNKYIIFGEVNTDEVFSDLNNRQYKLYKEEQCGRNNEFFVIEW